MSLKDLLNKSKAAAKPVAKPIEPVQQVQPVQEPVIEKKKPKLKLNFGGTSVQKPVVQDEPEIDNPFAGLENTLMGIDLAKPGTDKSIVTNSVVQKTLSETQFSTPTLSDVSKFVFNEQPDQSTQEIADDFSSMLDELSLSIGDQIPTNLSRCLKFMKENAFLADILKPENTQTLVQSIRKSYGYVVATQTEKGAKKKATAQKVNNVLDSLGGFSI